MRFLLVEDEYYARKALRQSVLGWQQNAVVAEAENGVTALAMLEQAPYDVVLLDIRMPQMDGLKLAEHVSRRFAGTYMIMITGYGEFEYARAAIHTGVKEYLLKPVDDDKLCDALTRAQEYWEEKRRHSAEEQALRSDGKSMRRLLDLHRLHMWLSGQEAEWKREDAGGYCMVVRAYGFSAPMSQIEQELQSRLHALSGMCCDVFPVKAGDICIFFRYGNQRPDRQARLAVLEKLRNGMLYNGMDIRMAMSGLNEMKDASHAYEQAQIALSYRLLRDEAVVCYGSLKEQTLYVSEPSPADLSDFLMYLSHGQSEQAITLARRAVQAIMKMKNVSLAALQDALNRLCACMNCAIAQTITKENGMDAELLQIEIKADDFISPAALMKRLDALITQVCALKERVSLSNADQVVDYLKQYISERYGENVALKELAESRLYLNPSYLSRLFKAKTGISFKNYLTQVRMNHACQMLESRERSVMNIAGECGYADASQFIQLFRKHFGMTPSVYRETQAGYKADIWLEKR